jgi:hypothetical protein
LARTRWTRTRLLALAAGLQAGCGLLLIVDMLSEISDFRGDPAHALLEIAILMSLVLGSALIVGEFRRMRAANARMEGRMRVASGAFLSVKGFSVEEIAGLRAARASTVRAQSAAVYRKAGVSSRAQLLGHFIDDLLAGAEFGDAAEE